jgi:ubiquinone/menaquinone biosynthesis C-methylase UbiE
MLAHLREIAPDAVIDVAEMSGKMISLAQARIGSTNQVRFLQQDARQIEFPCAAYDAVVTCFFLDCFPESEARGLVEKLARTLASNGTWLVSDFAIPTKGWQRWHASIWIWTMYRFFRITTGLRTGALPPIEKLLTNAGLVRTARTEERAGMIVSEVWRLNVQIAQDESG